MYEDAYLDAYWEDATFLEPLDGYGDEPEWDVVDDDPDIYGGEYSED